MPINTVLRGPGALSNGSQGMYAQGMRKTLQMGRYIVQFDPVFADQDPRPIPLPIQDHVQIQSLTRIQGLGVWFSASGSASRSDSSSAIEKQRFPRVTAIEKGSCACSAAPQMRFREDLL